ncbi:MAG: hypothetical protein D6816_01925 [Bacteroidetes bacterium]|nr:MAG: hypothetical protein D6816_01925 [Bacteroidota bacterium]
MRTLRAPGWLNAGLSILLVYLFTNLAWVFFRSPDFATAAAVLQNMASFEGFTVAQIMNKFLVAKGVLLIGFLLLVEISDFRFNYSQLVVRQPVFRLASFAVLLWLIAFFGTFNSNAFIYFQF